MDSSTALNTSCLDTQLSGKQVLSDDVETILRYFILAYYCLLAPFSITLTSFIIFLIIKFKHLRDTTFLLALQVIILDFVFTITLTPVAISTTASGQWLLGSTMCTITGVDFNIIYQLRSWLMFVFVFDRFCNVFMPFRYVRNRKKVILTLWLIILALSAICVTFPAIFYCYGFNRGVWICISAQIENCPNFLFCQVYAIVVIAVGQMIGSFVPLIMYILLFIKAKRVRNQITPAQNTQVNGEQRKRDRKANLTFFAIFLSLFGVNFPPIFVFALLEVILPILKVSPPQALIIILYLLQDLYALLPIMDSIAILRNPEMRRAINTLRNRLINRRRIQPATG